MNLSDALRAVPVVAIVRDHTARTDLVDVVGALVAGGVRAVEVTVDTPGWAKAVTSWSGHDDVAIGAGTVRTVAQLDELVAAGGVFGVSPHTDERLIRAAVDRGLAMLPGALTPTEVDVAVSAGAAMVKLFPAGTVGDGYLRSLLGPFAGVEFVPTGGIALADVRVWLDAGAVAVGLGGSLVSGTPEEIRVRAAALVAELANDGRGTAGVPKTEGGEA